MKHVFIDEEGSIEVRSKKFQRDAHSEPLFQKAMNHVQSEKALSTKKQLENLLKEVEIFQSKYLREFNLNEALEL